MAPYLSSEPIYRPGAQSFYVTLCFASTILTISRNTPGVKIGTFYNWYFAEADAWAKLEEAMGWIHE